MRRIWNSLRIAMDRIYPFTFAGSLLLLVAFYLSGSGFARNNLYAFVLGALALLLLAALAFDGRLQAFRLSRLEPVWESSGAIFARLDDISQAVHLGDARPHYFFRFHFRITGQLHVGRAASLPVDEEAASSRPGGLLMPLYFPLAGRAAVRGRLYIKDVFGLTRAGAGLPQEREFTVRPPLLPGKTAITLRNTASFESSRRSRQQDEEKYYMREYQAGDRLKDINWKASFRIQELITRISPRSPEESRLLHIEFRNFAAGDRDAPEQLMHLNYIKSWMFSFVQVLRRERPEYQFRIVTSDEVYLVESDADLDRMAHDLSALNFASRSRLNQAPTAAEKFIFTTPFDPSLEQALTPGALCHVFRTALPTGGRSKPREVRFLPLERWLGWPGTWIFRRNGAVSPARSPGRGTLLEEPLRTLLF